MIENINPNVQSSIPTNILSTVSEKVQNFSRKTVCPKCFQYPLIQLIENQPEQIIIKCPCRYEKTLSISDYNTTIDYLCKPNPTCQNEITHTSQKGEEFCLNCNNWLCSECLINHKSTFNNHSTVTSTFRVDYKCKTHPDKDIDFFCKNCQSHLCQVCKLEDKHDNHMIISLDGYLNHLKMNQIKQDIDEAKLYVSEYYAKIKNNVVQKLKEAMLEIEKAYETNQKNNNTILSFIQALLDNYSSDHYNYYSMTNILNNTNFKYEKIKEFEDNSNIEINQGNIDKLINYLKSNHIYKKPEEEISQLKQTHSISNKYSVASLLLLQDGRLACCYYNKVIKIFNVSTFKCEQSLLGHTDSVSYITQLNNGKLISCSDKTIKIWEPLLPTFKCIKTLNAHEDWIVKVISISNNRIASCSWDKTIKIWKSEPPYNEIKTLVNHTEKVTSIIQLKNKEILISGATDSDSALRVWNTHTYDYEKIIMKVQCCYRNGLIEINNNRLCVGGQNRISIINLIQYSIEKIITDESLGFILCFEIIDTNMLCGTEKGKLYKVDLLTFEGMIVNEKAHHNHISSIQKINDRLIASGSWDKNIRLWSY